MTQFSSKFKVQDFEITAFDQLEMEMDQEHQKLYGEDVKDSFINVLSKDKEEELKTEIKEEVLQIEVKEKVEENKKEIKEIQKIERVIAKDLIKDTPQSVTTKSIFKRGFSSDSSDSSSSNSEYDSPSNSSKPLGTKSIRSMGKITIKESEIDEELNKLQMEQKFNKLINDYKKQQKDSIDVNKHHDIYLLNQLINDQHQQIEHQTSTITQLQTELIQKQEITKSNKIKNPKKTEREIYLQLKNKKLKQTLSDSKELLENLKNDDKDKKEIQDILKGIQIMLKYVQRNKNLELS